MSKEHPILFSAPMVRAILAGTKTQTRRVMKFQPKPEWTEIAVEYPHGRAMATYRAFPGRGSARWAICECPYGSLKDTLWVKETHARVPLSEFDMIAFRATAGSALVAGVKKWTPSIFMPRKLSRITLEIESVRVERLKSICHNDCLAEGLPDGNHRQRAYWDLWDSINGKGASDANPWVWAITFRRLT